MLKTGLYNIWGAKYTTFEEMLVMSNIKDLQHVRDKILRKLLNKSLNHPKFSKWFVRRDPAQIRKKNERKDKEPTSYY